MHPETKAMVEGGISDRTVSYETGYKYSFVEPKVLTSPNRLNASRTSRRSLKRPDQA